MSSANAGPMTDYARAVETQKTQIEKEKPSDEEDKELRLILTKLEKQGHNIENMEVTFTWAKYNPLFYTIFGAIGPMNVIAHASNGEVACKIEKDVVSRHGGLHISCLPL